jgi:hypothetical protein
VQILSATHASPGHTNEDFVLTGPSWAIVLDGASARPGIDTGCIHSVSWFVHHLGTDLADLLTHSPDTDLDDALAAAIATTARRHEHTCDLSNPDSPSATAAAIRRRDDTLDYLTLADSPLLLDINGEIRPIIDDRTAHLPDYSDEGVRTARNSPNGFYVASTLPSAAHEAIYGSIPITTIHRAALLSDGATRLVERFHTMEWPQLLDLLTTPGPTELIRRTRQVELRETEAERLNRRGKKHDDATAVLITNLT